MSLLDLVPGWAKLAILAALAAAAVGLVGYQVHHQREIGRAEVRAEWDADTVRRQAAALAQAEANARESFRRLERGAEAERKKNATLQSLERRLADALDELRSRPDRPATAAAADHPALGQACTGAQLYRPDAEFLAREAARAQRILAERDYCHDRYDALTSAPAAPGVPP